MKYLLPVIITVMALFAPLPLSAAEKKGDQHIKSIFFQKNNGREVVQIRLSGKVAPKVFELGGEKPRVVMDFVETGYLPNKIRTIKAGGALISKIRVGLHDKPIAKTRVVIDMVEGMKYAFSKEYIAADTIFRITFREPQAQASDHKKVQTAPTEQVKNGKPVVITGGENRILKPSTIEKERHKSVVAKNTEESKKAVTPTAQTSAKPELIEERGAEGNTVGNREGTPEENNGKYTDGLGTGIPEVEDKDKQILLDVTYEKNTSGNEMVLFRLNGFYPPVVYSAESGELLVVCDFLDAELGFDGIPIITKSGKYIRQIKMEPYQQPKKVRVVIELADRYIYDVKQVFFKEDNLFVIVINSLGEKNKEN